MPQSPLFGKPLAEQHVYLPYYEGNKTRKSRCCTVIDQVMSL